VHVSSARGITDRDSERAYSGGQLHGGKVAVVVGVGEADDSPASVTRRSMNTDTRLAVMAMDVIVVHGMSMVSFYDADGTICAFFAVVPEKPPQECGCS